MFRRKDEVVDALLDVYAKACEDRRQAEQLAAKRGSECNALRRELHQTRKDRDRAQSTAEAYSKKMKPESNLTDTLLEIRNTTMKYGSVEWNVVTEVLDGMLERDGLPKKPATKTIVGRNLYGIQDSQRAEIQRKMAVANANDHRRRADEAEAEVKRLRDEWRKSRERWVELDVARVAKLAEARRRANEAEKLVEELRESSDDALTREEMERLMAVLDFQIEMELGDPMDWRLRDKLRAVLDEKEAEAEADWAPEGKVLSNPHVQEAIKDALDRIEDDDG